MSCSPISRPVSEPVAQVAARMDEDEMDSNDEVEDEDGISPTTLEARFENCLSVDTWQVKGTLSQVDVHSSIQSLRELSRLTTIMEISVSRRILRIFCF